MSGSEKDHEADRRQRAITRSREARFFAHGPVQRIGKGKEAVEFEPLLVRTQDKERSLRLLSIAEESASDIARLLDTVLAQARVLADQAQQLDQLRAEVDALRRERVATEVTKEVNKAVLGAAKQGVAITGFEFRIDTEYSASDEITGFTRTGVNKTDGVDASVEGDITVGSIFDYLKGAHLSAKTADATIAKLTAQWQGRQKVVRARSQQAAGYLRYEQVTPPADGKD